jgi:hypothetical protein
MTLKIPKQLKLKPALVRVQSAKDSETDCIESMEKWNVKKRL